jgi:hypothetical protein
MTPQTEVGNRMADFDSATSPGYLGHRETHPMLRQEVLDQYHTDSLKLSFVLFDEIEKASDALWNLLLGILDKATLDPLPLFVPIETRIFGGQGPPEPVLRA